MHLKKEFLWFSCLFLFSPSFCLSRLQTPPSSLSLPSFVFFPSFLIAQYYPLTVSFLDFQICPHLSLVRDVRVYIIGQHLCEREHVALAPTAASLNFFLCVCVSFCIHEQLDENRTMILDCSWKLLCRVCVQLQRKRTDSY